MCLQLLCWLKKKSEILLQINGRNLVRKLMRTQTSAFEMQLRFKWCQLLYHHRQPGIDLCHVIVNLITPTKAFFTHRSSFFMLRDVISSTILGTPSSVDLIN